MTKCGHDVTDFTSHLSRHSQGKTNVSHHWLASVIYRSQESPSHSPAPYRNNDTAITTLATTARPFRRASDSAFQCAYIDDSSLAFSRTIT